MALVATRNEMNTYELAQELEVDEMTALAIVCLRDRGDENLDAKVARLVEADHAGNPVPLTEALAL